MRIAFLANRFLNPDDPRSWSGLPFFMRRALEQAGVETLTLMAGDVEHPRRWTQVLYWRWLRKKRFLKQCDLRLLESHARQYERRLAGVSVDALFSPSTWPLAFLGTKLPAVVWTDACFAGMHEFYESFSELAAPSIRTANIVEQRALQRSDRVILSTEWAVETTQQNYSVESRKIRLVPFGANLQEPPSLAEAIEAVERRPMEMCRLLLVGVDWKRKGVEIAIETAAALVEAGVDCRLTVAGCSAPPGRHVPSFVEVIPFLNKASADDRRRLNELFARSHFFLMPSRAEAFGIVYVEANTFGVPSLGTAVGGLASVIRDGVNGHLFPLNAAPREYAAWIMTMWRDPRRYRALALSSAREAAARFSWAVTGRQVADIVTEVVSAESCDNETVTRRSNLVAFSRQNS